jgi:hypothetical protein
MMATNLKSFLVFTAHARDPILLRMNENEWFLDINEHFLTHFRDVSPAKLRIVYMVCTVFRLRALIKTSQQPDPVDADPLKTLHARMYRRALAGEPGALAGSQIKDLVTAARPNASIHFIALISEYHISYTTSCNPFLTIF